MILREAVAPLVTPGPSRTLEQPLELPLARHASPGRILPLQMWLHVQIAMPGPSRTLEQALELPLAQHALVENIRPPRTWHHVQIAQRGLIITKTGGPNKVIAALITHGAARTLE